MRYTRFNPSEQLKKELIKIKNPGRYVGGDYQLLKKNINMDSFLVGICFPDLYEIGMSNNAIKILYDLLNKEESIVSDHVFAIEEDYEEILKKKEIPLYTIHYGIPLHELDVLCVSFGYELLATNVLSILSLGKIPLHAEERRNNDPIVIAGGPVMTNPLPFSKFLDVVYIGEAENGLAEVINHIKAKKKQGVSRTIILEELHEYSFLWFPDKTKTERAVFNDFALLEKANIFSYYCVPNLKVVQDHGVVEIMRGCPNGCRFCHAGEYYKPYRQKSPVIIKEEVSQSVHQFGYRDITLSSLSSGDHPSLQYIVQDLNNTFSSENISFSLPSLKVNSFTLNLLEGLSATRKSGLTFAIETPLLVWQRSMNKEVPIESVISIIKEAKSKGWKLAKFYFMTGLPFVDREFEIEEIVNYIFTIYKQTGIHLNINIGTFIPKPHTPFQWALQMTKKESEEHLRNLKFAIQNKVGNVKVSYHDPFTSFLEGIISRGDERVADLIEKAFYDGARLDAWDEYIKKDVWSKIIENADWDVEGSIFKERDINDNLPWDSIQVGSGKKRLIIEYQKAQERLLSNICSLNCKENCGVCSTYKNIAVTDQMNWCDENLNNAINANETLPEIDFSKYKHKKIEVVSNSIKYLFSYRKFGSAIFLSHIHVMRIFEQSFQRAGIPISFTQGFNPKPKIEFVNPISLGIVGEDEIFSANIDINTKFLEFDEERILNALNSAIPEGFNFTKCSKVSLLGKKHSLSAHYAASKYTIQNIDATLIEALNDCIEKYKTITISEQTENSITIIIKEGSISGTGNLFKLMQQYYNDKFNFISSYDITRNQVITNDSEKTHYFELFC